MAFAILAAVLLLPSCLAAVISLPLEYATGNSKAANTVADHDVAARQPWHKAPSVSRMLSQQTLNGQISPRPGHSVEIWDAPFPNNLIVPAALGNPAQPFRLLVDLTWDTLVVPSADLDREGEFLRFFSNRSHTYDPGNGTAETMYWTNVFKGNLSRDEFRIAGISVPDQPFINANESRMVGFIDFWFGYDGVLGLSPAWNSSRWDSPAPSPWSSMVERGLLNQNLFTLDLPHGPRDDPSKPRKGSLTFGGIDPKYADSRFAALPLSGYTNQAWTVQARSVTWHNKTHPIHQTFENYTLAGFDTTLWYLGFPSSLAREMVRSVPSATCDAIFCYVDCDVRADMPDLTVGLYGVEPGIVKEFTITAFDYAPKELMNPKAGKCSFNLISTDDQYPVDAIVLGTKFLSAFYSVFDLDAGQVRLTKAIR